MSTSAWILTTITSILFLDGRLGTKLCFHQTLRFTKNFVGSQVVWQYAQQLVKYLLLWISNTTLFVMNRIGYILWPRLSGKCYFAFTSLIMITFSQKSLIFSRINKFYWQNHRQSNLKGNYWIELKDSSCKNLKLGFYWQPGWFVHNCRDVLKALKYSNIDVWRRVEQVLSTILFLQTMLGKEFERQ